MAVLVEGFSVIVHRAAIDAHYPGGLAVSFKVDGVRAGTLRGE